ncbi:MAG: urease accessory protein UreD [Chloroflexota bacterium]
MLAHLTVTTPTGGFVQGDRVLIELEVATGAAAHVTSQSAARAYRCVDEREIEQQVRLVAGPESLLEWWPDTLIPYAGTRLAQSVHVTAPPSATVLIADTWLAGRVARGEVHQYDQLRFETSLTRPDGTLEFIDRARFRGSPSGVDSAGILSSARACGSFFFLGERCLGGLQQAILSVLDEWQGTAGVSVLPSSCGLVVRALCSSSDELRGLQWGLLWSTRQVLFGRGAEGAARLC